MIHLLQREFVSQSIRNGTFRDFTNLAGLLSQMSKRIRIKSSDTKSKKEMRQDELDEQH